MTRQAAITTATSHGGKMEDSHGHARSLVVVLPSLYEGYGMAIAEGFQAGIAVIAGTGGAQQEVGGQGSRQIDPSSPVDIAAAMVEMLDPATRAEWVARGQERLARLTDPAIDTATLAFFIEQGRLALRQRSRRSGSGAPA